MYFILACALAAFILALVLTQIARRLALSRSIVDVPNERSSHTEVVPRGGGLAIVTVFLVFLILFPVLNYYVGILFVAIGFALLGWADDVYSLSAGTRLLVQGIIAIGAVVTIGEFEALEFAGIRISNASICLLFTLIWVVWMVNLYNFMDGIDGIAGVETVVVATTMGIWFYKFGFNPNLLLLCWVLAAASLGFLVFNWPPAKVFMGDVGSVSIGGVFAVLTIIGVNEYDIPLTAYIILLSIFISDSTLTLIRRLCKKENIFRAHRSHYYQRAVIVGWSHKQVTLTVFITNIVLAILGSMAAIRMSPEWLWPLLTVAVLCLLIATVIHRERSPIRMSNMY
ncbi:glycosyltransferase family 4 protein [Pseudomonadota bacterium]